MMPTCKGPVTTGVCVPTVEDHICVVPGAIGCSALQEGTELGLQALQSHATGGVVAAKRLNHVMGEEALNMVQHGSGAQVQSLHLVRGQESGLAIWTARQRERK